MFYESEMEHRRILKPYLADGLSKYQKILYFCGEHTPEVIQDYVRDAGLDAEYLKKIGQLEFKTASEIFPEGGMLSASDMMALLQTEIDRAQQAGFTGLRASGEVSRQAQVPDIEGLYDYHQELNRFLPGTRCTLLCEYDKRNMHPEMVQRVLAVHPLLLQDHHVIRNPFYGEGLEMMPRRGAVAAGRRWMECIEDLQRVSGRPSEAERDFVATVLDAEGALVIVLDREGRIELFNRACEQLTGYTFDEVVGKHFFDIFLLPEERDAVKAVFDDLSAGHLPSRHENHWATRDGGRRLIAWSNTGLLDARGNVEHIIGTGIDVTELRGMEAEQREAAQRFEIVADLTTDLMYEYDPALNELRWFGDIDAYLGFPPGEEPHDFAGWLNIVHPDDREKVKETIFRALDSGRPFTMEHRVVKKDGAVLHWASRAAAIKDAKDVPVRFIGAVRDITARKAVDAELMHSESRFRSLFENAPFGILIHRLGTVLLANPALLEMFGVGSMSEVVGTSLLEYLAPEERERIAENYLRRMAGEKLPNAYETVGLTRTGRHIPLYIVVVPLELEDGPALMVYMMDITERKVHEDTLRNKAEELKNFLTIAAHELRHPITILKGYARVIGEYGDNLMVQQSMPEILENMDKAANRLDRLVDELLDVSRIEQGRWELRKETIDTRNLLAKTVEEMHLQGVDNPISYTVETGAEEVFADPEKFDRLLLILLENAANFAAPMSAIEMTVEKQGEELLFSVLDRGSGIPEEARERVFERFYQVAEVEYHSIPGLGMGLYIARQIVEAHGGRIWNEARPGGGTAFRFTLPLA